MRVRPSQSLPFDQFIQEKREKEDSILSFLGGFVEGGIPFVLKIGGVLFSLFLGKIQAEVAPIFLRAGRF
jgi:hypothetical protein